MHPTLTTYWLSILCLLFAGPGAHAQAAAAFDSPTVETGDTFHLHLTLEENAGQPVSVDFSAWDSIFPSENILRQSGWRRAGGQWRNDVTLITFDSAELDLMPLTIRMQNGRTEVTNALTLSVTPTPSPDEPGDLADIEDIRREPWHWLDALPWVLLTGGLLALAGLIYWLVSRRRREATLRAAPPRAHELALRRLDELARWRESAMPRADSDALKTYYAELTHIVRQYLENRYQVPALESVSDEILEQLQHTEFPPGFRPTLSELLRWADLVKFAKGTPPADFHEIAWQNARRMVLQTAAPDFLV